MGTVSAHSGVVYLAIPGGALDDTMVCVYIIASVGKVTIWEFDLFSAPLETHCC